MALEQAEGAVNSLISTLQRSPANMTDPGEPKPFMCEGGCGAAVDSVWDLPPGAAEPTWCKPANAKTKFHAATFADDINHILACVSC